MAMKIMGLVIYNVAWAEAYLPTKWHLDPSSCLATIHMGRKVGGGCCAPFQRGAGSPSNTMWPRPRPTSVLSGIDPSSPLSTIHGPKKWRGCCAPFCGELGPHLTVSPGLRPISLPSGSLIHPAVWPQQTRAFWGGELAPHLTQCGQGRGLPPCQVSS